MVNRNLFAFILLFGLASGAYAQEEVDTSSKEKEDKEALRSARKTWNAENTIYKPVVGLGAGFFNYFGEINNNERINPVINNYGFQASVFKNFSPSFGLEFDVAYGKMTARERSVDRNLNFSTDVVNFNLKASYNFAGILRPGRFLNPFISVGVGAINFNTKGDLRDENGVAYHYWNDGTIRSAAQPIDGSSEPDAEILRADYVYETDLRKANLDSLGNYKQFAVTIPATFGLHFKVSPRSAIRLSSTFSYAFTDLIDNYTKDGVEGRKGNAANDMFLFTTVSYHFDFFSEKKKKKSPYDDMEFESIEGDEDGDGVSNLTDRCSDTPKGVAVDESGCPLDSDGDGIPDFRDEETSPEGAVVDVNGRTIDPDFIVLPDTNALNRDIMYDVYPEMREAYGKSTSSKSDNSLLREKLMTETPYGIVDTDENGIISVEEVYQAIDKFFDGELDVSAKYINELIDYFFEQ